MRSKHVQVTVNLDSIRANSEDIRRRTGVTLIAVIKADAYGLGAPRVADALASIADDFAYFNIDEAREVVRPGIVLGPPDADPSVFRELALRPCVGALDDARRFRQLPSVLNVDTGMQRFGCDPLQVDELLAVGNFVEACTHTTDARGAALLYNACSGRIPRLHAAASGLVDAHIHRDFASPATDKPDVSILPAPPPFVGPSRANPHSSTSPTALAHPHPVFLDAVRPGYALYRSALRVTTRLTGVRDTRGPAGYSRFNCPRIGVILAGYSNGVRSAPVLINGRRQNLLEIGMNTSFVSVDPLDRDRDEVVLLGDGLHESELASHFHCRPHEILCRYASMGPRSYLGSRAPTPDA